MMMKSKSITCTPTENRLSFDLVVNVGPLNVGSVFPLYQHLSGSLD